MHWRGRRAKNCCSRAATSPGPTLHLRSKTDVGPRTSCPAIARDARGPSRERERRHCYAPSRPHAAAGGAQAQAGGGAVEQYLAAEADGPRRSAASAGADLAGLLDQTLLLDEAAEILLV